MEAYRFFNLRVAPFEARPDPRFFHEVPAHREALATLEYTVYARKTCALVVGESGSGKTLLARMLAQRVNTKARVLWVDGIGQPEGLTELTMYPPGTLTNGKLCGASRPTETTLAEWVRVPPPVAVPTLLVVDNADGLRAHSWEDLLTIVTRDVRMPRPASVILLGLPRLIDRLGSARLIRLRRRVFRTCRLDRLTLEQSGAYVMTRLRLAGCGVCPFTDAALAQVHYYSGGNPALINQICDNALIEAYGDERKQIDGEHIHQTVQAITGPRKVYELGRVSRQRLGALDRLLVRAATPDDAEVEDFDPVEVVNQAKLDADEQLVARDMRSPAILEDSEPPMEGPVVQRVATAAATATELSDDEAELETLSESDGEPASEGASTVLVDRLRVVEVRISDALSRVRAARSRVVHQALPLDVAQQDDVDADALDADESTTDAASES